MEWLKSKTYYGVILLAIVLAFIFARAAFAEDFTVATGGKDGYYHNGMFNIFAKAVKRSSDGEFELSRYSDSGTDGTKQNISLVNKGEADVAFCQLGGLILDPADNVEVIGTIMYEVAHLVVPMKGNVDDVGDLESKKQYSVGMNTRSGAAITWAVFCKVDEDYKKASIIDIDRGSKAIAKIAQGKLDSYFFVSSPGTKLIRRVEMSADVKFGDVWDGDFDDFQYRGKDLYKKIKVSKKEGYDKKFVSVAIPAVVIANASVVDENPDFFDALFDATATSFQTIKGTRKLKYYPK